jgi:hypothetical protein
MEYKHPNISDVCSDTSDMKKEAKNWIEYAVQQKIIKSIPWSEFRIDSEIGAGGFGSVSKVYWESVHGYVACKKLNIHCKTLEAFKHELHMQIRADSCENIVRILGISKSKLILHSI